MATIDFDLVTHISIHKDKQTRTACRCKRTIGRYQCTDLSSVDVPLFRLSAHLLIFPLYQRPINTMQNTEIITKTKYYLDRVTESTSYRQYELSTVRVIVCTSYREYELSRVRVIVSTTGYREYQLSRVRVIVSTTGYREYELSRVRVIVSTTGYHEYELSYVRVIVCTSYREYELS